MNDGGSSPGYQARLARAEEQLAELQAEVAELKRILGRPGCDQVGQPRDGECDDSVAVSGPAPVSDGLVRDPACAEVRLTILAATASQVDPHPAQGSALGDPADADTGPHVAPVAFVQAPRELRAWAYDEPEPLRGHIKSVLEAMREQFSQSVAGWLVDSAWEPVTGAWRVTDFAGFDILSGLSEAVGNWEHQEVGTFAEQLGRFSGLPGIAADGAGLVVRYLVPLPTDQSLEDFSRLIQVTGIVAFALAGGHVLACASLKSLVHDELTDLVAKGLRDVISPRLDGPGSTPGSADTLESPTVREREITESKPPGSISPDPDAAAESFSFFGIRPPSLVSQLTLGVVSGLCGESAIPDSHTSPTPHLPDDECPDNGPEIKI